MSAAASSLRTALHDDLRQPRIQAALLAIALAVVVLIAYRGVADNDFINFDDKVYVTQNRHVQQGLSSEAFVWALTSVEESNWHPLTWISLMADRQWFGMNPAGYHRTNLILHLLSTLFLFLALRRMTGHPFPSFVAAGLFGVHPLHVESVAWIAERKDVLSALFWMLGLWAYARYAERPGPARYLAVFGCFILGLLSKSMVVTFPCVLLLLDFWPLRRWRPGPVTMPPGVPGDSQVGPCQAASENGGSGGRCPEVPVSRLLLEKIPFLILAAAVGAVTLFAQGKALAPLTELPLGERVANALVSYCQYLGKTFIPIDLAVFYPHPGLWPFKVIGGAALLLLLISGAVLRQGQRRPYLAVGWLWYLGTLAPVSGLVQVGAQAMADRYTYLPSIGLSLMAVWGLRELAVRGAACRRAAWGLAGSVLLVLTIVTHWQVGYWRDGITLFSHALQVTRENYQAQALLGEALVKQGQSREAMIHFREAIRIHRHFTPAYGDLAQTQMNSGDLAAAMDTLKSAIEIEPGDESLHFVRAELFARLGRIDEAIADYRFALPKRPNEAALRNNLGVALLRRGLLEEADRELAEAIRIQPDHAGAHANRGMIRLARGELDEAIQEFRTAILYQPEYAAAHYQLSCALESKGLREEARVHLAEAQRINPAVVTEAPRLMDRRDH